MSDKTMVADRIRELRIERANARTALTEERKKREAVEDQRDEWKQGCRTAERALSLLVAQGVISHSRWRELLGMSVSEQRRAWKDAWDEYAKEYGEYLSLPTKEQSE